MVSVDSSTAFASLSSSSFSKSSSSNSHSNGSFLGLMANSSSFLEPSCAKAAASDAFLANSRAILPRSWISSAVNPPVAALLALGKSSLGIDNNFDTYAIVWVSGCELSHSCIALTNEGSTSLDLSSSESTAL